jgi:hypothetical protein
MISGAHVVITSTRPEADVMAFIAAMKKRDIACGAVKDQGWGLLTQMTLPGGGKLSVYQPRHERPKGTKPAKAKTKK